MSKIKKHQDYIGEGMTQKDDRMLQKIDSKLFRKALDEAEKIGSEIVKYSGITRKLSILADETHVALETVISHYYGRKGRNDPFCQGGNHVET